MVLRRCFISLALASIFVIGIWLVGSVPQATAGTLNFKTFTHVTKAEMVPIADVEGHAISLTVREGAILFQDGEWAWMKSISMQDFIKGAGTGDSYITVTFQDGSTFTARRKQTMEATSQGMTSGAKITGNLIHGTGRFQGIKGTYSSSSKTLPPEKGELGGKGVSEGTLVYTLPGK